MKISAVIAQFPVSLSIQNNLEMIAAVLQETRAGDLVLFPEGSLSGYATDLAFLKGIDPQELTAGLKRIQKEAEKRSIHVWVGACMQRDVKWFNCAYGFSAGGSPQVYHKINLANHERGTFSAGDQLPVFTLNLPGGKVKIGVQICRELRFPEQWGWLARSGAQLFLHLNNAVGDDTFQPVWKSHLVSRAAETQRFVLSANNAAPAQVSPTIAIAPNGQVMAEVVSEKSRTLRLELDLSRVTNFYLDQSRADIVAFK
jgi:predicted amidohydrolase